MAARVVEHRPARLLPLVDVSPAIESKQLVEQRMRLLTQQGEATIQALAKGEEKGLNWSAFQVVGRQASAVFDAAGAKAVFRVNTDNLPAYTGFMHPNGSYRVVRVTRVVEAPTQDPMLLSSIGSGVTQALQRADLQAMSDLIKAGQKVKIKPNAIEGR